MRFLSSTKKENAPSAQVNIEYGYKYNVFFAVDYNIFSYWFSVEFKLYPKMEYSIWSISKNGVYIWSISKNGT